MFGFRFCVFLCDLIDLAEKDAAVARPPGPSKRRPIFSAESRRLCVPPAWCPLSRRISCPVVHFAAGLEYPETQSDSRDTSSAEAKGRGDDDRSHSRFVSLLQVATGGRLISAGRLSFLVAGPRCAEQTGPLMDVCLWPASPLAGRPAPGWSR